MVILPLPSVTKATNRYFQRLIALYVHQELMEDKGWGGKNCLAVPLNTFSFFSGEVTLKKEMLIK